MTAAQDLTRRADGPFVRIERDDVDVEIQNHIGDPVLADRGRNHVSLGIPVGQLSSFQDDVRLASLDRQHHCIGLQVISCPVERVAPDDRREVVIGRSDEALQLAAREIEGVDVEVAIARVRLVSYPVLGRRGSRETQIGSARIR